MWDRTASRRGVIRWSVAGIAGGMTPSLANATAHETPEQAPPVRSDWTGLKIGNRFQSPELRWQFTYGESAGFPYDIVQTGDGGFAFLGRNLGSGSGLVVTRTKPGPEPTSKWQETVRPGQAMTNRLVYRTGFSVVDADDGVVCSAPSEGLLLFKLDGQGNVDWKDTYADLTTDAAFGYFSGGDPSVIGTGMIKTDDGYLLTGLGGILVKTDAEGKAEWHRVLTPEINGKQAPVIPLDAVQTSDGGYAIAQLGPLTDPPEDGSSTYWPGIVTVDGRGAVQWRQQYRGPLRNALSFDSLSAALPTAITRTASGGLALAGVAGSQNGQQETFVVRTNPDGGARWSQARALPNTRGTAFGWTDLLPAGDGGLLLLGTLSKFETTIRRLDAAGEQVWSRTVEETSANSMARTEDGGLVLCGITASKNSAGPGLLKFGGSEPTRTFDPETHGFGFTNFEITAAHRSPASFDVESIQNRVVTEWNTQIKDLCGTAPGPLYIRILGRMVAHTISSGLSTLSLFVFGHCYGMAATAKRYFQNPDTVPVEGAPAASLTDPTNADVHAAIDAAHRDQLLSFENFLTVVSLRFGAGYDLEREVQRIEEAFEPSNPVIVGVSGEAGNHAVLVYDVESFDPEDGGTGTRFHIYDNNFAADEDKVTSRKFETVERDGEVSVNWKLKTRTEKGGPGITPMNKIARLDGPPGDEVCRQLLDRIATFEVHSPATLRVRDPDGEPVHPMGREDTRLETSFRFDVAASAGEYTIEVLGTGSGEYTLDVRGATPEGPLIDERMTGTIQADEAHEFAATVPEKPGEGGSLHRSDGADGQDPSGDRGTRSGGTSDADDTDASDEPTTEEGTEGPEATTVATESEEDTTGGSGPGFGVGAAVSTLAGGAYLAYRQGRDDEEE